MIINRIEGTTHTLAPPEGMDKESCVSLPVRLEMTELGPIMVSSWQPTPDEIVKLYAGAPVLLYVYGTAHPPVSIQVGDMPPP